MRFLSTFLVASCLGWALQALPSVRAASRSDKEKARWLEDLPAAKAVAARESRPILLDFTGSDWCTICRKYQKEVLDQSEFQAYARSNLVLVVVDFPERKRQSPALVQANEALKTQFAIGIFPTFVLLSADGTELGRQVGYLKGGPKAFIAKLEQFRTSSK